MPRLNGKSSHGSNPMTSLSRTFSWMPHCWPQKQQCVFTRASGGWRAFSSYPPGGASLRCGPHRSMSTSGDAGRSAKGVLPHAELGRGQAPALASRAERLPVTGRPVDRVVEPELGQHGPQVLHMEARGEALAAAGAERRLSRVAHVVVELHPQLGG